jgi:hypothetical protein
LIGRRQCILEGRRTSVGGAVNACLEMKSGQEREFNMDLGSRKNTLKVFEQGRHVIMKLGYRNLILVSGHSWDLNANTLKIALSSFFLLFFHVLSSSFPIFVANYHLCSQPNNKLGVTLCTPPVTPTIQ